MSKNSIGVDKTATQQNLAKRIDLLDLIRKKRRRKRTHGAPIASAFKTGFVPLVPDDGLAVRVVFGTANPSSPAMPLPDPRADRVRAAFRAAFEAVWRALSDGERCVLLGYWFADDIAPSIVPWPGAPRPFIQVLEDRRCRGDDDETPYDLSTFPLVAGFGHAMSFPVSGVFAPPQELRLLIGRALFRAHRWASGRHLERASRLAGSRPTKAKDATREKRRASEVMAEEAAALRRWGLLSYPEPLSARGKQRA